MRQRISQKKVLLPRVKAKKRINSDRFRGSVGATRQILKSGQCYVCIYNWKCIALKSTHPAQWWDTKADTMAAGWCARKSVHNTHSIYTITVAFHADNASHCIGRIYMFWDAQCPGTKGRSKCLHAAYKYPGCIMRPPFNRSNPEREKSSRRNPAWL